MILVRLPARFSHRVAKCFFMGGRRKAASHSGGKKDGVLSRLEA